MANDIRPIEHWSKDKKYKTVLSKERGYWIVQTYNYWDGIDKSIQEHYRYFLKKKDAMIDFKDQKAFVDA